MSRNLLTPVLGLSVSLVAGDVCAQQAIAVPAPVTSVNSATGDVTVPAVQRQVSGVLDATSGTVTWTFPAPFAHTPTCWPSLAATNVNYTFDYPTTTAISATAVTVTVVAHPSTVSITSLALPISLPFSANPPAGSTITLSCVGALP